MALFLPSRAARIEFHNEAVRQRGHGVFRRGLTASPPHCEYLLKPVGSIEAQLAVAERGEITIDDRVRDFGEGRWLPARALVLVDQRGAHALVEIVPLHEMLSQPVFEGE